MCRLEFWNGTERNPIVVIKISCRLWLVCVRAYVCVCRGICKTIGKQSSFFSSLMEMERKAVKTAGLSKCLCVSVCVLACTSQSVGIFRDCWQAWKCHSYILLQDRPSCVIHRISVVDTHTHTNTDSLTHTKSCMYRQMNARKNLHKAMQRSLTDASMLKSWLLTLTLWAYCVKARQQNSENKILSDTSDTIYSS